MSMLLRAAAGLLIALMVSGCGDDPGPATAKDPEPTTQAPFLVTQAGELMVGCFGQTGWPVSVMAEGIQGVLTDDDVRAIFAEMLELTDNPVDLATFLPDGPDTEWRLLRVEGNRYEFGVGPWTADGPGPTGSILNAEDRSDGWKWTGGGGCQVQPLLQDGNMWVELDGKGVDRDSTEPMIEVNEIDCTGARDPSPFLHDPFVVETDESVTVYWTSTPPQGGQTCPGNPSVSRPLPLDEPLGDRELLDGSAYPPSPVR
jgi:hypothetical protein